MFLSVSTAPSHFLSIPPLTGFLSSVDGKRSEMGPKAITRSSLFWDTCCGAPHGISLAGPQPVRVDEVYTSIFNFLKWYFCQQCCLMTIDTTHTTHKPVQNSWAISKGGEEIQRQRNLLQIQSHISPKPFSDPVNHRHIGRKKGMTHFTQRGWWSGAHRQIPLVPCGPANHVRSHLCGHQVFF